MIFLDSNVCMDMVLKREPWSADLKMAISKSLLSGITIAVSALTVMNMDYILSRKKIDADDWYPELLKFASIMGISPNMTNIAMRSNWTDREDALQCLCALEHQAQAIITRDKRGFSQSELPILEPREWAELMQ